MLSILTGGLSGLLGTALSSVMTYFGDKQKNAHELAMIAAQTDATVAIADAKVKGEIVTAEMKAFDTSQVQGNQNLFDKSYMKYLTEGGWLARKMVAPLIMWAFGGIDVLKGFIRPGLTLYLVGLTSYITFVAMTVLSAEKALLTHDQAYAIVVTSIDLVFYLTTTAVMWWFGERVKEKHANRGVK